MKQVGALDSSVRIISVTFNFNNWKWVPEVLPQRKSEGVFASAKRHERESSKGIMLLEPTEMVDAGKIVDIAQEAGYELVDTWHQARHRTGKPAYPSVRFVFARSEYATTSEEFVAKRKEYIAALEAMTKDVAWRVRAFRNPFFKNGRAVPGVRAFQLNLEARTPLTRPDGTPVTVWQKDEYGERVGDAPVALQPKFALCHESGIVQLVPAERSPN